MEIFSKAQLADHCGVSRQSVSRAVKSKRLYEAEIDGKQVIDIDDPRNIVQVMKWKGKKISLQDKDSKNKKPAYTPPPKLSPEQKKRIALEIEKEELIVKSKRLDVENKELARRKLLGDSISKKFVVDLIKGLGQSFQTNYKSGSDKILRDMFHEFKADESAKEKFNNMYIEMINEVHQDAIDNFKNELLRIVEIEKQKVK